MVVGNVRQALHDGMAGAQLLRLQGPLDGFVLQYGLDAVSAVAIDHVDADRAQLAGAVDDVLQQGLASERLQHLGQVALHALALPGGKDDDREGSEVGVGFGHGGGLGAI